MNDLIFKSFRLQLLLIFVALYSSPTLADQCLQLPLPSVTIKRLETPISTNFSYSIKTLNNLGASVTHSGKQVLGLTRGTAVVKYELKLPTYIAPSGRWDCSSPQITLSYGFTPLTVYVANEFPPGSCAYKEIYEHELRHVKVYENHAISVEKDITATFTQRFVTGGPWRGPVGQTQEKLQQEINERWIPFVKMMLERAELGQALIDTPEEYERVASSCNNEIRTRLMVPK